MPLEGLTVLDFTHAYAGPFCTFLLSLQGAKVVKIESSSGDEHRTRLVFDQLNAGKRSVVVDLKSAQGQRVVHRIAATADIVVENLRPGVAKALKVDADTLDAVADNLIHCSISGFGQVGPLAARPAIEWTVQAATGVTSLYLDDDSDPMFNGISLLDPFSGFLAYSSIVAAVLERRRTGSGQRLDISMAEGSMILQAARTFESLQGASEAVSPRRPTMARFPTADGSWIFIAALHDKWFARLCEVLRVPELVVDERFASPSRRQDSASELYALLSARTRRSPARTLLDQLGARGVPAELVNGFTDFVPELARDRGWTASVPSGRGSTTEIFRPGLGAERGGADPGAVPALGADTEAVLAELGFDHDEVEELVADGVVVRPTR
ncbi:CaiB/BaiF CoA transferase family protein [Pseudonocardia sp. DLS-67]